MLLWTPLADAEIQFGKLSTTVSSILLLLWWTFTVLLLLNPKLEPVITTASVGAAIENFDSVLPQSDFNQHNLRHNSQPRHKSA